MTTHKSSPLPELVAYAFLTCVVATLGCDNPSTSTRKLQTRKLQAPRPGGGLAILDGTSASFGVLGDGIAIVVWSKVPARSGAGGSRSSSDRPQAQLHYSGLHSSPDGRRIEWQCQTKDGVAGSVSINGQDYDLANGTLVLVTVGEEKTTVKQLKRDTLKVKHENVVATLEDWLENDSEIMELFRHHGNHE